MNPTAASMVLDEPTQVHLFILFSKKYSIVNKNQNTSLKGSSTRIKKKKKKRILSSYIANKDVNLQGIFLVVY